MPETCQWIYAPATIYDPFEFCDDEAVEGQPYCAEHGRLADA